jgi:hypothetical protein
MTSTSEVSEVLVQDTKQRVRVSSERRAALLAEFERSGMSAARFAAWSGVKYPTFAGWLQRRRRAGARDGIQASKPEEAGKMHWLEAVIGDSPDRRQRCARGNLLVHLPGGASLECDGASVHLAAELLKALSMEVARC